MDWKSLKRGFIFLIFVTLSLCFWLQLKDIHPIYTGSKENIKLIAEVTRDTTHDKNRSQENAIVHQIFYGKEDMRHAKSFLYYKQACGRFGNQIFGYASAYCLAVMSNHTPTISSESSLLKFFSNISANSIAQKELRSVIYSNQIPEVHEKPKDAGYMDPDILMKCKSSSNEVLLTGYRTSYKYFLPCADDVRQQLKICSSVQKWARFQMTIALLQYLRQRNRSISLNNQQLLSDGYLPETYTYIGVHVRRTDKKRVYAPITFFDEAIQHYRKKFHNAIFYVCSDDIEWCKMELSDRYDTVDILFMSKSDQSYFIDFAILINCNHSIITAGTFSFWVGWLTGGDVVYNTLFAKSKSRNPNFNTSHFYPDHWIGMQ